MKNLLIILPVFCFSFAARSQQIDAITSKSKTYGNFQGVSIASPKSPPVADKNVTPIPGLSTLTGKVLKLGWCEEDCYTIWIKKDNGMTVAVGTKDYGFSVPKAIVGKTIFIEGIDPAIRIPEKGKMKKEYQKDIQFAATGIRVMN